jgi:hypothetical protein
MRREQDGTAVFPMGRTARKVGFGAWDIMTPMRDEGLEVDGTIIWRFREVERHKRKDLAAWMEVSLSRGGKEKTWSARGVLTSTSFRSDAVRTIDRMFPEKNLAEYMADAVRILEGEVDGDGWDKGVFDAPPSRDEKTLLGPFIAEGSPNLVFGDGSSCKTYLCVGMMAALATGTPFMGYRAARKCKSLFLDYENDLGKFRDRLYGVCAPLSEPFDTDDLNTNVRYLKCSGGSVADRIGRIREIVEKHGIGLVVVDSALGACGSSPEDADTTGRYFEALNSLGVSTLTIAHVSKGSMDPENAMKGQQHAFGSIFWRNYPRATWNVQKLGDENDEEAVKKIILYNRKANDGPLHRPVPVEVDFTREKNVAIRPGRDEDWEEAKPLPKRLLEIISKKGPIDRKRLEEEVGESGTNVKISLQRMKRAGKVYQLLGESGPYAVVRR